MGVLMYLFVLYFGIITQINHCFSNSMIMTCLPKKHGTLFIFGDSLFDNGNNNYINTTTDYQANYPPYGQTFFKYPSGRFSDGRMIPDIVAEYAGLPLLPPYLHPGHPEYVYGVNFASGGSGALSQTSQESVIDLNTQLSYLRKVKKLFREKLGHEKTEELMFKSVYLFSVGSNDYGTLVDPNSGVVLPVDHQQFVDNVIENLSNVIKEIYELGGRKFGLVNVGPIGCSPSIRILVRKYECLEEISAVAKLHNKKLTEMVQKLENQLKGFIYSVTDFYSALSQVLKYPSKYGFKEASRACCGSGPYRGEDSCGGKKGIKEYELCENVSEHVFFDSHHPTDKANQHFARLIWNGNGNVTWPYNLKQLFEI
ncbi:GDSL esterase/lipase 1 [Lathyrus oleraceus]|uniref:Uncharacterized protein n=2 Tax=Pisum sativum TaxID=3888 RepID=A0A9D4XL80_PEA|nr:GDSL esterase/lipase 1-like [Pisum sativum]KAI5422277.1 hypothetical protein KIW84_045659 [Pisum sativum]